MIRLFVGLDLPPDLAADIAKLGFGLPGARWVAERNLHLTLRFIGEIDEGAAEDLHHALLEVEAEAFPVTLDGFGLFGDRHRARTLWLGVAASPPLHRLAAKVEQAAQRAGQPPEPRRFNPHITLARLSDTPAARLQDFIASAPALRGTVFPVERFTLFRSTLGRGGAEYDRLERYGMG